MLRVFILSCLSVWTQYTYSKSLFINGTLFRRLLPCVFHFQVWADADRYIEGVEAEEELTAFDAGM